MVKKINEVMEEKCSEAIETSKRKVAEIVNGITQVAEDAENVNLALAQVNSRLAIISENLSR